MANLLIFMVFRPSWYEIGRIPSMKKAVFLFLFSGIIWGCSSVQIRNPYLQREWMLISFENYTKDELIKNKAEVNLTAKAENGNITGTAFMGCNKILITSEFKNNGEIKISGVKSSAVACKNMDLETSFLKKVGKMKRYSVEGHFLTLHDGQGNAMKFIAADWD